MKTEKNKIENSLYIVPTPIGNLEDITLRALKVLSEVDIIASEDTRNSSQLLKQLNISYQKLVSYHEYNEKEKSEELIQIIKAGKSIALISDAGMPIISDPGYKLVSLAHKNNIKVNVLPGATAFAVALVGSGFPSHKFIFVGFPPHKKGRLTFITSLKEQKHTIILYESSHRLIKLLEEIENIFGKEIEVCIARELTKLFEEYSIGRIEDIKQEYIKRETIKGEIVVLINNN